MLSVFCHDKYECGLGDWGILLESVLTRIELMNAINFSESFTLAYYHGRVIWNSLRILCNFGVVADHSRVWPLSPGSAGSLLPSDHSGVCVI